MRTFIGRATEDVPARLRRLKLGGPALTAAAVLAIALLVSVFGSAVTYVRVDNAYKQQTAVTDAQDQLDALFRSQLDEETGLRGYLASGQKSFLSPYNEALPRIRAELDRLQADLQLAHLQDAYPIYFDLRHSHDLWEAEVGAPLVAHPSTPNEMPLLQRGKEIVDRIRSDFNLLTMLLERQSSQAADAVRTLLLRAALLTAALILLFGAAAIVADIVRSRTQLTLERERLVGDTLQRAFLSGWDNCPFLEVGTAYVSAIRHLAIGGDLFDVYVIDNKRCLLVVADISGKGLEAAVDTAFVKYSLRALVEEHQDPSIIVEKFNTSFIKSVRDETSFVSLFAGILDSSSSTLRYASAGHSPVYLRRANEVQQLPVTGPLVGLRPEDEFPTSTEVLHAHDLLILATDGLTEARDPAGVMLDDAGAMRLIREGPVKPQRMADHLVAGVTRASGGRIADDLALLIVEFVPAEAPQTQVPQGLAAAAGT